MFPKVLFILLVLVNIHSIFGQEKDPDIPIATPLPKPQINQRTLGDQFFAITAGVYIPLFTVLINDWPDSDYKAGSYPTNLYAGGSGFLTYGVYVSPNWKLGLQFGGSFAQDINDNFAYTIPIAIKGIYEFHPTGRISIPVFLGTGIAMSSWKDDNFLVDWILRPGAGFYFDWSYEWSFGIDFTYWFIPQLGIENDNEKSIGNFMDITLTAEYHF